MPDTDLRQSLHDLADEAATIDLLPRVRHGLRKRHRRRVASAAVAALAVIAGAVGTLEVLSEGRTGPQPPPGSPPTAHHSHHTTPAEDSGFTVGYLPAGFHRVVDPDAGP